ncbi:MAG: WbqC family protein [Selenomonadaceae bacterium]|nr:WbqC family protein [Selenomonadaceae bacterium]
MKLGIMQPYFFPYIGYFALINYVDAFIFFDTPQYIHHGWINRNRILKQNGEVGYMTVPHLKASRSTAIKDIVIDERLHWREKIFGQLTVYKKAPNYSKVIDFLHDVLDRKYSSLSILNMSSTMNVCDFLGISKEFKVFSSTTIRLNEIRAPDEWALNITKVLGYDTYVNPPGGMSFFDRSKYENGGIRLEFLQANVVPYVQRIGHFESNLSIIDVMMFCSVDEIKNMLNDYEIIC